MWFRRAYRNLAERRFKAGWAVGGRFVPFLNLVRPKQIADELWLASAAAETDRRRVSPLLHWWWAAYVAMGIVDRIAAVLIRNAVEIPQIVLASQMVLVLDVLHVVAGVLALLVVRRLTARLERAAEHREPAAAV